MATLIIIYLSWLNNQYLFKMLFEVFTYQIKHYRQLHLLLLLVAFFLTANSADSLSICQKIDLAIKENNQEKLQTLISSLKGNLKDECVLDLTPKYYWAQSMTHIFVKFQFLNSADTSACGHVLAIDKSVTHDQIQIRLICQQSSFILRYSLHIKTFMPLNLYHSLWKTAEQNAMILECLKSPTPYFWKRLYLPTQIPSRKPKIWWKIMEKNRENLKDFFYDLDLQEAEDDISSFVKQSKNIKKKKYIEQNDPHSDIYFYCNQDNPFQLGSWL